MRDDTPKSLAHLLAGLIDYAGLFPPAALPMANAVARYASYRQGPHAWALGRFIVPAARLEEFAFAFKAVESFASEATPWPLSVLADWPLAQSLERVRSFSRSVPAARIESLECRVATCEDLDALASASQGFEVFAEMTLAPVPADLLAHARSLGCSAKFRTGGTTPQAFPSSAAVASCLEACVGRRIPFKATAGLHHPLRSPHPVTYEAGAACAVMHGFLNVFMAAALLHQGAVGAAAAGQLLEETDPSAFVFAEDGARCRELPITAEALRTSREIARSFGSCSFEEPMDDLATLGFLHHDTTATT